MPRFHVDLPLSPGLETALPSGAARHVQVLRLQPGDSIVLFDGAGSDWPAQVLQMGRSEVRVRVGAPVAVERELPLAVTLAVGMPANERMDWLVEKATELGAGAIEPLLCERSVLRLSGERAEKKRLHWQAVAIAAAEQSGRARVPLVAPVTSLAHRLAADDPRELRLLLSLGDGTGPALPALQAALQSSRPLRLLSGPEGGLSPAEDLAARAAGWLPVTLGPRVLRAETAPLALLATLASLAG
ncbi:16S rRNA (uracil(1498)-N(3))-methyltransferase [Rivibacter subsaxonicus]|uniref:Ribosomal RNA small subunit methyltransferase E n=1 Tax=Rivibacter subsaxonicus TaxID=457575 RepID=A0A4Q7VVI3_9BURK|nr:16S rRNA (uracil(1498)-N(3))-methyltransferase [Rivibacter subsaxonicus]RZU00682.1 16S rRNA (uracil1498-N3)-methyltransferase [Rivibacter subsaxonicus]